MANWTAEEINILKDGYENGANLDDIAVMVGRNKRAVISKASALGFSKGVRAFSEEEKRQLEEWYKTHTDELHLDELAKKLDRTVPFLCRQARTLGLTKLGRKPQKALEESAERLKEYNAANPEQKYEALKKAQKRNAENPPVYKRRPYTAEEKEKMSARMKAMWEDPSSVMNSAEYRELRSKRQSEIMRGRIKKNSENYSRCRGGRREDLNNMYFRSAWEANYARYLNFLLRTKNIYKWEYEPDTFYFEKIKRGTRSYTPDFKIWDREEAEPYYVEIKGWMDDKSKTKLNRMERYFPDVEIRLVQEKEYKEIKNKVGRMLNFE